jgi:hypothetical protein
MQEEEMMAENMAWESDESEDGEGIEAIAEAEDAAEDIGDDIGERVRRRRRKNRYRPARGVRGMTVRDQNGGRRNVAFPAKLATTDETNRGLARQELGRRELETRLERIEAKSRGQQKRDSSATGLVTLLVGGGLATLGFVESTKKAAGNSRLADWASSDSTKMASLASVTQIATSGAKFAMNGRYHRSGFGTAADLYSAAQLAAFAIGKWYQPRPVAKVFDDLAALRDAVRLNGVEANSRYAVLDTGDEFETFKDNSDKLGYRRVWS